MGADKTSKLTPTLAHVKRNPNPKPSPRWASWGRTRPSRSSRRRRSRTTWGRSSRRPSRAIAQCARCGAWCAAARGQDARVVSLGGYASHSTEAQLGGASAGLGVYSAGYDSLDPQTDLELLDEGTDGAPEAHARMHKGHVRALQGPPTLVSARFASGSHQPLGAHPMPR